MVAHPYQVNIVSNIFQYCPIIEFCPTPQTPHPIMEALESMQYIWQATAGCLGQSGQLGDNWSWSSREGGAGGGGSYAEHHHHHEHQNHHRDHHHGYHPHHGQVVLSDLPPTYSQIDLASPPPSYGPDLEVF